MRKPYKIYEYDFVLGKIISPVLLETFHYAIAIEKAHQTALQWCENEYPAEIERSGIVIGLSGNSDFGSVII